MLSSFSLPIDACLENVLFCGITERKCPYDKKEQNHPFIILHRMSVFDSIAEINPILYVF
jgi:hypothetical protein